MENRRGSGSTVTKVFNRELSEDFFFISSSLMALCYKTRPNWYFFVLGFKVLCKIS